MGGSGTSKSCEKGGCSGRARIGECKESIWVVHQGIRYDIL
jgi:hypothetical protein